MCRNINVHGFLAAVIVPEVCDNVHVFGTAHNVTVGVEKADERSCVLDEAYINKRTFQIIKLLSRDLRS